MLNKLLMTVFCLYVVSLCLDFVSTLILKIMLLICETKDMSD